jgi:exodeoxyribonuclease VII small subunit
MADDRYTFEQARIRLEEIASEVRKKDTSLERSLDLLEEGVRLANICTELVDHADFDVAPGAEIDEPADALEQGTAPAPEDGSEPGSAEGSEPEALADDASEDVASQGDAGD